MRSDAEAPRQTPTLRAFLRTAALLAMVLTSAWLAPRALSQSVSIAPVQALVAPFSPIKFIATLTHADGTTQRKYGVWTSSNPAVATVDNSQTATAGTTSPLAEGTTTITVTANDETGVPRTAQASLTVRDYQFVISPASYTFTGTNQTLKLAGTLTNLDGSQVPVTGIAWWSSTPSVASVGQDGVVMSVGAGKATITASYATPNKVSHKSVTAVTVGGYNLGIQPPSAFMPVNAATPFTAWVKQPDGSTVQIGSNTVAWSSGAPGVAGIDAAGNAKGIAEGAATISGSFRTPDGILRTATAALTVRNPRLDVSPNAVTLFHPSTGVSMVAKLTQPDGSSAIVTPRGWSSSNTAIANVVNGVLTSYGVGRATLTAFYTMADGVTRSAQATVDVWALKLSAVAGFRLGTTTQALVNVTQPDGTSANLSPAAFGSWQLTFQSGNTAVLASNATGLVTGLGLGKPFLRVNAREPVSGTAVAGIAYAPGNVTINVADGYKLRLDPSATTVRPFTGSPFANAFVVAMLSSLDGTESKILGAPRGACPTR